MDSKDYSHIESSGNLNTVSGAVLIVITLHDSWDSFQALHFKMQFPLIIC
jgi:hypothetical protein